MTTLIAPAGATLVGRVASPSQREAIEAKPGSLLVLAGPGAGKTYCLTERIRFLIEEHHFDPARICAFTFTNKAAGEIATRLESRLGETVAAKIKRGTIHAFCAELLRELGAHVLLEQGFGIADEEYQLSALRRIEGHRRWHRKTLTRFSAHRFRGDQLHPDDIVLFEKYERFLNKRKVVDFDTLVIKAAELLEGSGDGAAVRSRWDVVLVDEFQDLNPIQYGVVRALAKDHGHVFGVGDSDQSIYSWAGADSRVFNEFLNDFKLAKAIQLGENHRCTNEVFALAQKLVVLNPPQHGERVVPRTDRASEYPISTIGFETDEAETRWIIDDVNRDRLAHPHEWGDVALLYRKHEIGNALEAAFLNAGIPCRLAKGRALSEDPVVAYVLAALRVIVNPNDDIHRDAFFAVVLPRTVFEDARAQAEAGKTDLRRQLNYMSMRLPRAHGTGRQIRRALTDWRNLVALGKNHTTVAALVQQLLSRRVGKLRSPLDDHHDEISDPDSLPDVKTLAARLQRAREKNAELWMPRMGGVEIALKNMLASIGFTRIAIGDASPVGAERIEPADITSVGLPLGVFKAAQLIEIDDIGAAFDNFTSVDLETTDNDTTKAEIVEIAAVRVREGRIVDEFHSLVKPRMPIAQKATETHGYNAENLVDAPYFEDVWPTFRAFCGSDVIVAHNGYEFDFRILQRMVKALEQRFDLCTYDTLPLARDLYPTSRKLVDLARQFGVDTGRSHHALDDTRALANIVLKLDDERRLRARSTALTNLLDHLGIALALTADNERGPEAERFLNVARPFSLGRYTTCLDDYEREQGEDLSVPTVDEVIERLGGAALMVKIRAEKSADERYPAAMLRLRRLIAEIPDGSLEEQLAVFLERALLSKWEGHEPERKRVNLLTMHSTKGLEFSRVYVIGVEDDQLPGGNPTKPSTTEEIEEARRLLYVGMTRTIDRLVMTRVATRNGRDTRGHQFLDEMGLAPMPPEAAR